MLAKLPSFLGRFYPLVFLVLVVCGPFLLLPHTLAAFTTLAIIDSAVTVVFAGAIAIAYLAHRILPGTYQPLLFPIAARVGNMTRCERLRFYFLRLASYASTTLLILSAHPTFAVFGILGHVAAYMLSRLLAKIRVVGAVAVAVADFKKD